MVLGIAEETGKWRSLKLAGLGSSGVHLWAIICLQYLKILVGRLIIVTDNKTVV